MNYYTNMNLVKPEELTRRSPTKFNFPFLDITISFYEFWKFELFSAI
jgi:hypothetical protein